MLLFLQNVLVNTFTLVVDEGKGKIFGCDRTNCETGIGVTKYRTVCFIDLSGF